MELQFQVESPRHDRQRSRMKITFLWFVMMMVEVK